MTSYGDDVTDVTTTTPTKVNVEAEEKPVEVKKVKKMMEKPRRRAKEQNVKENKEKLVEVENEVNVKDEEKENVVDKQKQTEEESVKAAVEEIAVVEPPHVDSDVDSLDDEFPVNKTELKDEEKEIKLPEKEENEVESSPKLPTESSTAPPEEGPPLVQEELLPPPEELIPTPEKILPPPEELLPPPEELLPPPEELLPPPEELLPPPEGLIPTPEELLPPPEDLLPLPEELPSPLDIFPVPPVGLQIENIPLPGVVIDETIKTESRDILEPIDFDATKKLQHITKGRPSRVVRRKSRRATRRIADENEQGSMDAFFNKDVSSTDFSKVPTSEEAEKIIKEEEQAEKKIKRPAGAVPMGGMRGMVITPGMLGGLKKRGGSRITQKSPDSDNTSKDSDVTQEEEKKTSPLRRPPMGGMAMMPGGMVPGGMFAELKNKSLNKTKPRTSPKSPTSPTPTPFGPGMLKKRGSSHTSESTNTNDNNNTNNNTKTPKFGPKVTVRPPPQSTKPKLTRPPLVPSKPKLAPKPPKSKPSLLEN